MDIIAALFNELSSYVGTAWAVLMIVLALLSLCMALAGLSGRNRIR